MAKPTPTPSQIIAINTEVTNKTTQQNAFNDTAVLQDDVIAQKQEVDDAFKALFDYYNDDIINQFDLERKAISGVFVISPIVEADIIGVGGNPPSGRLIPTAPATNILRVDEFDAAGYTDSTLVNEQQHITNQTTIEDLLVNGVSGTNPTVTGTSLTASALSSASTTLDMIDANGPMSFSIGDEFVVHNGGSKAAVVSVTGVVDNAGGDPPYSFTLTITFKVAPVGTISSGADVINSFTGFNNTERTNKVASNSDLQPILDTLVLDLETALQARQARQAEQLAALAANQDPDALAEIATATTNANTSDAFITSYLATTDISNTGISALSTERGIRSPDLTSRLAEILANYTGQTEDYYEFRYSTANNRGNTQVGTLRELENAKTVKTIMLDLADSLDDSITALNGILP